VKLPIELETEVSERLSKAAETALYRIVQEALTNITKHASASRVCIRIFRSDPAVCCSIEDDGCGFDLHALRSMPARAGLGLLGIQERADSIGAILSIDSSPGRGTRIFIRLPVE
jgi:signal transduction histidine kinase